MNYWLYLMLASIFEVGWPIGIKLAEVTTHKGFWLIFALVTMIISGLLLFVAQKEIPIGTAYAVWTGIGASCTFLIGVYFFNDTLNMMRLFGIFCIICGVICLKIGQ